MKINPNPLIKASVTTTKPETESAKVVSNLPAEKAIPSQQAETVKLSQQKAATETKGFSDLNASMLRTSLSNTNLKTDLLKTAAKDLLPALPSILSKSGNDPERFQSAIASQLKTQNYALLGSMNNADIEAIAFHVLMQATKSAQEDLKAIMDSVKGTNNSKSAMRDILNQLNKDVASQAKDDGVTVRKKDDD